MKISTNQIKIGIVIAMEKEAKNILLNESFIFKEKIINKKIYEKDNLIIIISGIGKVNAAIATQILIDKYNISKILNIGTCGGLNQDMKVGSIYSIKQSFQYDFDLSEVDDVSIGYMQDFNLIYFPTLSLNIEGILENGILASGDRFSNKETDIEMIKKLTGNLRDMEGAAVAQTCHVNNIDCYLIKGVTDVYGNKTMSGQYFENVKLVCENLSQAFSKIIEKF